MVNAFQIPDSCEALVAFLLAGTTQVKPDPPVTKILGMSTYHCKLLAPLLTTYGIDKMGRAKTIHELKNCGTFDCSWLGGYSFSIDPDHITLPRYGRDESGSVDYLSGTLSLLRSYNSNRDALVPLHVDGDGHCLVHAVSRAVVGRELFWHALRTGLKQHLTDNLPRYKELLNDFINCSEWADIIAECDPDYVPHDNETLGLRNIHVFGLANVLRRPILLVDSVAGMQSSADYSALFLPGLIPSSQCRDRNGELNKPICLAWSSSGRNHYIPLVGIKGCDPPMFPRSLLPKVWGVSQSMVRDYIEFNGNDCLIIGGQKMMQDSYLVKLASGMDALFHQRFAVAPSLVADTYYCNFHKGAVFDMKPSEVLSATKVALQERRLFRCLNCCSVNMKPLNSEWLRPHGLLYNIAKKQGSGILQENRVYSFQSYGVTCVYNARKDMLVVEKSTILEQCSWCGSDKLRLIHFDGKILYENGDKTATVVDSSTARCKCGFKHWYNGQEYDNPPLKISVSFQWKSRTIVEEVNWFQDESDPLLDSDPHQIAAFIIHKHLPGERDIAKVRQAVLESLLGKTKSNTPTSTQTRPETESSLDTEHSRELKEIDQMGQCPSTTKKSELPLKSTLNTDDLLFSSTSKKRHSDSHGGALPKQRSTPASLAAAAAISRAEASKGPRATKEENKSVSFTAAMEKAAADQNQIIRLGPGYSVISDSISDEQRARQKRLQEATEDFLSNIYAVLGDSSTYSSPTGAKSKGKSCSPSSNQRGENIKKKDAGYGSLSRVANLLNVGGDRHLSDDCMSNSEDEDVL